MSIKNIAKGFANLVLKETGNLSPDVRELAENRLEICAVCPKREKLFGASKCSVCHCVLSAKTLVEDEVCPENKW